MRINEEVKCKTCKKVFCCAQCREKHEVKSHAIVLQNDKHQQYMFCPICEHKPFAVHLEIQDELLTHIGANHLPLRCRKCAKIYENASDLREFSKCLDTQKDKKLQRQCAIVIEEPSADEVKIMSVAQTQTSPSLFQMNISDNHTPICVINERWKAKSKLTHEEFIGDSVSSIKNLSSINSSASVRHIGIDVAASTNVTHTKGKLVRSTSTPVHAELMFLAKPKEQTFNGFGAQVSSIYNSGCEPEKSPAVQQPLIVGTPTKQVMEHVNRYRKAGGRLKVAAVTPLRQVMSKSIQKALAASSGAGMLVGSPLDLRLSPAIRRTQSETSENSYTQHEHAQPATLARQLANTRATKKLLIDEAIVITRTQHHVSSSIETRSQNLSPFTDPFVHSNKSNGAAGSVYQTCHSVEIITSTELSNFELQEDVAKQHAANGEQFDEQRPLQSLATKKSKLNCSFLPTPISRIPGAALNKKLIKFESPNESHAPEASTDVFYTPLSSPTKSRPHIGNCARVASFSRIENVSDNDAAEHEQMDSDNEVFLPANKVEIELSAESEAPSGTGRLWSYMSSVMRFTSLTRKKSSPSSSNASKTSLLKRCASIAGSLVRSRSQADEEQLQTLKRKRTYTMDMQPTTASVNDFTSKRFRIHGRRPIERMRNN